jgi:hypothetical protein
MHLWKNAPKKSYSEKHENRDGQNFALKFFFLILTLIESIFSLKLVRISETSQHKILDF